MLDTDLDDDGPLLGRQPFASVLHEARQAHVAIQTRKGPHITPALYSFDSSRLWFFAASGTRKAATIETGSTGAAAVQGGAKAVVLTGTFERLDPLSPTGTARARAALTSAPGAVRRYLVRNGIDLFAFASDLVRGRAGPFVPARRVLFALHADRVALVDGADVVETTGDWEEPSAEQDDSPSTPAREGEAAVVGWMGPSGPLALPGRWRADDRVALVSDDLMHLSGAHQSGRASVVLDEYGRPGPRGKQGTLVRGEGAWAEVAHGWRALTFEPERRTSWDGVETTSEPAS
jgi:hypothetical protein